MVLATCHSQVPGAARGGVAVAARRRVRMAGDVGALRDARHLVADALGGVSEEMRDVAVLLAGEVVTNAVVHGGGWFMLEVEATEDRVRVEVTDADPAQPRVLRLSGEREHGRGMAIVDKVASVWGTDDGGTYKVVWFELMIGG